ncbi:hypothetical protein LINPERPRIM_LOCUS13945 [Linum perenne]
MAKCVDSENPKALLCLGIEDYFYDCRDEGIRYLRFMAEKGMKAAKNPPHIASKSVNDLFNAKEICKLLFEPGFECHVMQNATVLDKFYRRGCIEQRRTDYSRFMTECVDSENPKTLLCLGIEYYFYGDRDEGIQNLRFVAEKDMKAANYVCEILSLLTVGDVENEEGLRFLEGVRKADDVRECRNMLKFVMDNNMWVNGDRGTELEKKKKTWLSSHDPLWFTGDSLFAKMLMKLRSMFKLLAGVISAEGRLEAIYACKCVSAEVVAELQKEEDIDKVPDFVIPPRDPQSRET